MRILDLFCGLGGASVGYARAGFEVVGVDIDPQPDYPFDIYCADVMRLSLNAADAFDAIHASPPCAAYTALVKGTNGGRGDHPRFYEPISRTLRSLGKPYVIENPAAHADVVLCGEMFGLGVLRHRRFELGHWAMPQPAHLEHRGRVRGWRHGEFFDGPYVAVYGSGGGKASLAEAQRAMGIDWSDDLDGIVQAIPPAYTEHIGRALLSYLGQAAA